MHSVTKKIYQAYNESVLLCKHTAIKIEQSILSLHNDLILFELYNQSHLMSKIIMAISIHEIIENYNKYTTYESRILENT